MKDLEFKGSQLTNNIYLRKYAERWEHRTLEITRILSSQRHRVANYIELNFNNSFTLQSNIMYV